eukprot:4698547-Prymnesium_polylepis.1
MEVQTPFTNGRHGTSLVERQQPRRLVRSIRPWMCSPQWLATMWATSGMSIFLIFQLKNGVNKKWSRSWFTSGIPPWAASLTSPTASPPSVQACCGACVR